MPRAANSRAKSQPRPEQRRRGRGRRGINPAPKLEPTHHTVNQQPIAVTRLEVVTYAIEVMLGPIRIFRRLSVFLTFVLSERRRLQHAVSIELRRESPASRGRSHETERLAGVPGTPHCYRICTWQIHSIPFEENVLPL